MVVPESVPDDLCGRIVDNDRTAVIAGGVADEFVVYKERIAAEINAQLLGKTVEVLVEGRKKDKWQGRSRSGKLVFFNNNNECLGQLMKIRIEKTSPWSLQGKVELSSAN